jgi:hypothetical protein
MVFNIFRDFLDDGFNFVSHLPNTAEHDGSVVELLLGEVGVTDRKVGGKDEMAERVFVHGDIDVMLLFLEEGEREGIDLGLRERGTGRIIVVRGRVKTSQGGYE